MNRKTLPFGSVFFIPDVHAEPVLKTKRLTVLKKENLLA